MSVRINPAFLLALIESDCDEVIFTTAEAITRVAAQAIAVATVTVDAADFVIAVGDAGGDSEKISLLEQAVTWSATGTVSHACFFKTTGSEFIMCAIAGTPKPIVLNDDGTISEFKMWEIGGVA